MSGDIDQDVNEKMRRPRFDGTIGNALVTAVSDRLKGSKSLEAVPESLRIRGKTCLVTGASSGLGKAAAMQLAVRGANVILTGRSGIPTVSEEINALSESNRAEMVYVDFGDLNSVRDFCDVLRDRRIELDVAIFNAGLSTAAGRQSKQGYELMFAVHCLANRYMVDRFLADGVIKPRKEIESREVPRLIFVSSEAHRSAESVDFNELGNFVEFQIKDALRHYGASKMALCAYACELSRRLNSGTRVSVAVHTLCPGAVATNIAREAPQYLQFLVKPIMRLLFRSPENAIEPIIYLACSPEAGSKSGVYLHVMHEKDVSSHACDESNGRVLWQRSQDMIRGFEAGPDTGEGT